MPSACLARSCGSHDLNNIAPSNSLNQQLIEEKISGKSSSSRSSFIVHPVSVCCRSVAHAHAFLAQEGNEIEYWIALIERLDKTSLTYITVAVATSWSCGRFWVQQQNEAVLNSRCSDASLLKERKEGLEIVLIDFFFC